VSKQTDKQEVADLRRLNAELTRNIQRCRDLLADCREKLAANGNLPGQPEADDSASAI
jgi:hypothetical protein